MRTWIKNTLIAALGASVALGGMAFASNVRDGCGWHSQGPMSEADSAKFREGRTGFLKTLKDAWLEA